MTISVNYYWNLYHYNKCANRVWNPACRSVHLRCTVLYLLPSTNDAMNQLSQIRLVRLWASINTHTRARERVVKPATSTLILHQYFSTGGSYITEDTQPILFDIFPTIRNITQFIYFWKTALHVSGGNSAHHQEHTQLYLQYLALVKPLLLAAAIVAGSINVLTSTRL